MENQRITVLGAGSWGTTLSILLAEKGFDIYLWDYLAEHIKSLKAYRENRRYLPGIRFPERISLAFSLEEAVRDTEIIILAIPSHAVREVIGNLAAICPEDIFILSGVKGIDTDTLQTPSQIVIECFGPGIKEKIAVLSGPSHAEEVSRKLPTVVVVGTLNQDYGKSLQNLFLTPNFRVYTNSDLIGVELAGALKNIIALASGISDGLGFGDNTKSAIITRGLVEMIRLGVDLGAKEETFFGLAGIGDLVGTCTSKHSRNRQLGEMLGRGLSLSQALGRMVQVAEGVKTTQAAYKLSQELNLELPITEQIHDILFKGKKPFEAVTELMRREVKPER
ncbi:MAG: NAD(P)H-dependent glycerol-3-phosphate dehydrogenase [bacterium]|nr:NAD(P)H-dependent glycerol-3-phosphate dehydrogenase [bacterium]